MFNMAADARDYSIVRSTIALAHDLGMHVVAESVEDRGVANLLAALDCDSVQGFLFAEPMLGEEVS